MASATASVYPSSYINRNYLIKVNGLSPSGDKLNVLVGVSGAISIIGEELFYKFVARADRDGNDKTVCKPLCGIHDFVRTPLEDRPDTELCRDFYPGVALSEDELRWVALHIQSALIPAV